MQIWVRVFLTLTTMAPTLAAYALISLFSSREVHHFWIPIIILMVIAFITQMILKFGKKNIQSEKFDAVLLKTADGDVFSYMLAYIAPIILRETFNIEWNVILVSVILFLTFVWNNNAFYINPMLNFFGFNFYEVESKGGITYLIISRRKIKDLKTLEDICFISCYVGLDKRGK